MCVPYPCLFTLIDAASISAIVSGPRQAIPRVTKKARTSDSASASGHVVHTNNRNELDTRADTCVLGQGWRILSCTGQVCDVKGFHNDYEAMKDIPVCQAATLWTADDGRKYILIINEGLFFGSQLDHSLINPNQSRHMVFPYLIIHMIVISNCGGYRY